MAPLSVQRVIRPLCWLVLVITAWQRPLMAQELDWVPMPYSYVAEGESLRDVLVNFGANYEVSVVVSDKVNDQVNGQFEHDEPLAFLQQLASLYNLVWYYDGNVLYVFKNSEVQSRLINLEQTGAAELKQALQRAGIWEPRFGWRPDADNRLVYVSGPPRYLELIEQTAVALEQQSQLRSEKTGPLAIEIFPLKYASATDRSIQYRDTSVDASGVATILSRLLSDAGVQMVNGEGSKGGASCLRSGHRTGRPLSQRRDCARCAGADGDVRQADCGARQTGGPHRSGPLHHRHQCRGSLPARGGLACGDPHRL